MKTASTAPQPDFFEKNSKLFFAAILISAVLVRLMVAYSTVHYYDISYYVDWSAGASQDLFGAYKNIGNLDYPPLFLYLLSVIGKILNVNDIGNFEQYRMLLLKFWQIGFDICIICLLYLMLSKRSITAALSVSSLWAISPTMILNSSYWGQTDSIMIFLLLLSFWKLTQKQPVFASVVMTLACLMKFQSLYFAPLFGIALLVNFPLKQVLRSAAGGIAALLVVCAPFIARSGPLLLWDIYFGGYSQYPHVSLNACNLYGAIGLNMQPITAPMFGVLPVEYLSATLLVASLFLLLALYMTATEKSVWLVGAMFMQTVFMFTTRMHERYQVPVLAFLLVAAVWHSSKRLFAGFLALSVVTFFNQFIVLQLNLAGEFRGAWLAYFETIVTVISVVNIGVYIWLMYESCRICYAGGRLNFRQSVYALFPKLSY